MEYDSSDLEVDVLDRSVDYHVPTTDYFFANGD